MYIYQNRFPQLCMVTKRTQFIYLFLNLRSGLAVKKGINVGAGVVDYDYRGNVGVVLFNHLDTDFVVERGDNFRRPMICELGEFLSRIYGVVGHLGLGSVLARVIV